MVCFSFLLEEMPHDSLRFCRFRRLHPAGSLGPCSASAQTLFINEFMASNSVTVTDPDYQEYGDWVELYNPGDAPVNLRGYSITDLFAVPRKYVVRSRSHRSRPGMLHHLDR